MMSRKEPPTRIFMSGPPYFAEQVGRICFPPPRWQLRALYHGTASKIAFPIAVAGKSLGCGVWYRLSGYSSVVDEMLCLCMTALRVPVILHWMGTDVLRAAKYFEARPRALTRARQFHHWATAPWLVNELEEMGVHAEFVPFAIHKRLSLIEMDPPPLPEDFSLLTYVNDSQPRLYNWDMILRLAEDMPDMSIKVVGNAGTLNGAAPRNLSFLGWVDDMGAAYTDCVAVLRMTRHDGYSGSIQEPLILGRHAIWTHPFPSCRRADDYATLHAHVTELRALHARGKLGLNRQGREHVVQNLHPDQLAERVRQRVSVILDTQ